MKIAVFYHTQFRNGWRPISSDYAISLMASQMHLLVKSGLADTANFIFIGVNGDEADGVAAASLAPEKSVIITHPKGMGELETLRFLAKWAKNNPDAYILYHHAKGLSFHGKNPTYIIWRQCMEIAVIDNWNRCITDLERGFESVGPHWMTRERYGFCVTHPYWGGNFWWARASFLNTLPPVIVPKVPLHVYEAEAWIGRGQRPPRVRDYAPHFPCNGCRGR